MYEEAIATALARWSLGLNVFSGAPSTFKTTAGGLFQRIFAFIKATGEFILSDETVISLLEDFRLGRIAQQGLRNTPYIPSLDRGFPLDFAPHVAQAELDVSTVQRSVSRPELYDSENQSVEPRLLSQVLARIKRFFHNTGGDFDPYTPRRGRSNFWYMSDKGLFYFDEEGKQLIYRFKDGQIKLESIPVVDPADRREFFGFNLEHFVKMLVNHDLITAEEQAEIQTSAVARAQELFTPTPTVEALALYQQMLIEYTPEDSLPIQSYIEGVSPRDLDLVFYTAEKFLALLVSNLMTSKGIPAIRNKYSAVGEWHIIAFNQLADLEFIGYSDKQFTRLEKFLRLFTSTVDLIDVSGEDTQASSASFLQVL